MKHIKLYEAFGESQYNMSERIPTEIRVKFARGGFDKFYEDWKPEGYTNNGEQYIEDLKDGTGMRLDSSVYGGYDLFRSTSDRVYFLEYLPRMKEIYMEIQDQFPNGEIPNDFNFDEYIAQKLSEKK